MLRELFARVRAEAAAQAQHAWQVRIDNMPIRSLTEPYSFGFSCTIGYQPARRGQPHPALPEVDKNGILQRVVRVAAGARLTEAALLQTQLSAELGLGSLEPTGELRVWATDIVVTAAPADVEAVQQRYELHRKMQVWQYEREIERKARDFTAEMLADPNRAVAWWLSHNPQQVVQAIGMVEPIARLSAIVHGQPAPDAVEPTSEDQLLAATEALFTDLDELSRALLGDQLAKTLAAFGQIDRAERVRERFDTPGPVA
jgi:hypothetical protein